MLDIHNQNIIATYEGVEVPDAPHFTPRMREELNNGRYEKQEVRLALQTIRSTDRVVEMGAGAGVVGAIMAKNCAPEAVWSYEANPDLISYIQELYEHNDLSKIIKIYNQIIVSDSEAESDMDFFVMGNFLGSGVQTRKPKRSRKVTVPTLQFEHIKAAFNPNVLIMDIEGFELPFFENARLDGIRLVVVELHPHIYEREGKKRCRRALRRNGLHQNTELSKGGVFVFERLDKSA